MFGETVRTHRRRLGLSQEELAQRAGVSVRNLRNIETGRTASPRPVTLRLLADVFGLAGDDLTGFCTPGSGPWPAPAQLPADVAGWTGRDDELRQLTAALTAGATAVISGTAGVGKTALAVHWAHLVADRFPDGQLYANLRAFGPDGAPLDAGQALRGFLEALHVPAERVPAGDDAQAALLRSLLAGRQVLVLLDNALDAAQVRPLLPGSPGCLAVVTSRDRLAGLVATEGARPVLLEALDAGAARGLLTARLGADRLAADPEAVRDIVASCAGLPLALAVVAARAATHPRLGLRDVAADLRERADRLDALAGADPAADVRSVLSWSYSALPPDAARLFRLLGLHPGPDLSADAAAGLAGLEPPEARRLLDHLTRVNLLAEPRTGRYALHDLPRAYAAGRAAVDGPAAHATTCRMLEHYLRAASAAAALTNPARLAPPRPADAPAPFAGRAEAEAWFAAERYVLVALVRQAADAGLDGYAWRLACAIGRFFEAGGHWPRWRDIPRLAVETATRAGDRRGMAHAHHDLGRAYALPGRYDDALTHLRRALALFAGLDDPAGQAHSHDGIGWVLTRQARHPEALGHAERSLALYRAAGDELGQARSLNNIGWAHAHLGDQVAAVRAGRQAVRHAERIGDAHTEATAWDTLGHGYHCSGRFDEAVACHRRSVDLYQAAGEPYQQAQALGRLGGSQLAVGDPAAAHRAWRRALRVLEDLDHPEATAARRRLCAVTPSPSPRSL